MWNIKKADDDGEVNNELKIIIIIVNVETVSKMKNKSQAVKVCQFLFPVLFPVTSVSPLIEN